jgi:hypothetical protein
MDVRLTLQADPATGRFEREHAEAAKHKPHVLAPEDIAADVASEAEGHVGRPRAKDPREERKGKPKHPPQDHLLPSDASSDPGSDESGEHHILDVRV